MDYGFLVRGLYQTLIRFHFSQPFVEFDGLPSQDGNVWSECKKRIVEDTKNVKILRGRMETGNVETVFLLIGEYLWTLSSHALTFCPTPLVPK